MFPPCFQKKKTKTPHIGYTYLLHFRQLDLKYNNLTLT